MSEISSLNLQSLGALSRHLPEPESRVSSAFRSVLQGGASAIGSVAGAMVGIDPQYASLLQMQLQVQQQMQKVSMESNILKSKHETEMAPIRNLRVG